LAGGTVRGLIRFVVGVGIAVFHSRTTVMPTPQPFNFHSHPVTPQPIYQPAAQRLSSTSHGIQPAIMSLVEFELASAGVSTLTFSCFRS
jgi:hypothetical protein